MLVNCNALAASQFEIASKSVRKYTQQLVEMKKDLDFIFRKISFLRDKVTQQYPDLKSEFE